MATNKSPEELVSSHLLAKSDASDSKWSREEAERTRVKNKKEPGFLNHEEDLA